MQAYLDISLWAWMMAIAIVTTLIVFAVYAFMTKKRMAGYSEDFAKAIHEFNDLCNPGRPMKDDEWETYASFHSVDFDHAHEVTNSKHLGGLIKVLDNAQTLVNIQKNHQALMADAKTKNNFIVHVNNYLATAIQTLRSLFDGKHYLAKSEADAFVTEQKPLIESVQFCFDNHIKEYLAQPQEANRFNQYVKQIEQHRTRHNDTFVKAELQRCSEFFDNVLAYPLDSQQRTAIVNAEDNCLVVSSAGSGKTSTIQGKVRYLIDICHIDPVDILLVTYTRKAAEELRDRIGYSGLTSSTFHGLAYYIISQVDKAPIISENDFALNLFYEKIKEHKFIKAITYYLVNLLSRIKDPDKYMSEREYLADRRKYGTQAYFPDMDGRIIFTRSEEERKICHFLSTHNIKFRYEERYEFNTATSQFHQYKPDFTIYYQVNGTSCKLYLEHFAIGKNGNVPKWFGQGNVHNTWAQADKKYKEGIMWKRKIHQDHGTVLIETTSAMFSDGSWRQQLTAQLLKHGVPVVEKTAEQVYQEIVQRDKHKEKVVLELVMSFINLLKANCKTIKQVADVARKSNDSRNLFIIENIVKPFYESYQAALAKRGEMDFTDAILQATDMCNNCQYLLKYKYIIIDEFQDISFDRYRFMMSLRSQSPLGKIFAVGDDWQSIYRFSGSDMGLFSDFSKYFGFTTLCKIESTYRFAQPAIGISSAFIQKNKSQVKKNVKSPRKDIATTIFFEGYREDNDLVASVAEKIKAIPVDKTVYILSRYSFDFIIFRNAGYAYREVERNINVTIGNRKVQCLTVHQAKGLEADYVFLLKCDNDIYGFPSMISDDPVLEYLLSQQEESVEFAEERRVFYVAITRAKINTTIFYQYNRPSVFVDEIIDNHEQDGFKKCPNCEYGHMKILKQGWAKTGKYFVSLGCTNAGEGCTYFHTLFFDQQPSQEIVNNLVLSQQRVIANEAAFRALQALKDLRPDTK